MQTEPIILSGNHARFFRAGAAYTIDKTGASVPGTAGRNARPGTTDPAWVDLGAIEELKPVKSSEKREMWAAAPGRVVKYRQKAVKKSLGFNLRLQEPGALVMELIFETAPLTPASTQYNPLEGADVFGWLQIQQYDSDDRLINTVIVWCHLSIPDAPAMNTEWYKPELVVEVLHSIHNDGTLIE